MKPETRFWNRVCKLFPEGHLIRVENPIEPGTPDVNFVHQGREVWFELKYRTDLPKLLTTPVFTGYLKPDQIIWLATRASHGGECYILAGAAHHVFCIPGKHAQKFNHYTLDQLKKLTLPFPELFQLPYNANKAIEPIQLENKHGPSVRRRVFNVPPAQE